MKNIFKTFILLGLVAAGTTSCKKYLDVNTNVNDVTTGTPEIILPQALAATGALSYTINGPAYGMDLGGYIANGGGVGGFGNFWTFVFNSGDGTAVWANTFDNLQDYQYILNQTDATGNYKYYNAIARLMKAYDYLNLVDAYGDVPYSQALKGTAVLLPTYDKAETVYQTCITEIDNAITQFKSAATTNTVQVGSSSAGKTDVLIYNGNTTSVALSGATGLDFTNWIKFANTVKLRAMLHISKAASIASFYSTEKATMAALTASDFITSDVLVQPTYQQQSGKQNPLWNALAYTYTGTNSTKNYLPSTFVTAFYNGTKLTDDGRGKGTTYRDYTHSNQLGFQSTSLVANPTGGEWFTGNTSAAVASLSGLGVMKGWDMGQPLITAAESYFLQAEGALVGLTPAVGSVATLFDNGMLASFTYLDKDHTDVVSATRNPATEEATYKTNNAGSYLVNSALWATPAAGDYNQDVTQRTLEAIITQKYIAVNTINSDQGWNDFRRTYNPNLKGGALKSGYPISDPAGDASHTFAPNFATNTSPRADKLAGRIIYPSTEYSYNTANVPAVNTSSTLVFWDARPTN